MFKLIIVFFVVLFLSPCFASESNKDIEKAKATIEREKKDRVKKCSAALEALLKEHRCQLDVGMLVTPKGNIPQVQLIPVD